MEPKPVADSQVLLAHWMGPTDPNVDGNIHGGTIMKLADEAAGLAAVKHARTQECHPVHAGSRHSADRRGATQQLGLLHLRRPRRRAAPDPVGPVCAGTPAEQRRMREAELRRTNRLTERAEMLARRHEEGDC